jgi:hypothetical protein
MQFKPSVLIDYFMADIPAALKAHNNVESLGQQIDHPALAFISPVNAHDSCACHNLIHLSGCFRLVSFRLTTRFQKIR